MRTETLAVKIERKEPSENKAELTIVIDWMWEKRKGINQGTYGQMNR